MFYMAIIDVLYVPDLRCDAPDDRSQPLVGGIAVVGGAPYECLDEQWDLARRFENEELVRGVDRPR